MARPYDPLVCIPSPDFLRRKLEATLTLAERLRILLEVAERIGSAQPDGRAAPSGGAA